MEIDLTYIISVLILTLALCRLFVLVLNKACDIAVENVKQMSKDFDDYKKNKGEINETDIN